jgi:SPP1 gp7 family putative phage head morphogenesis protein
MRFNAKDPYAIRWAQRYAAELAKGISDTTRDDIKEAIAAGLEGEFTRAEVVRAIKQAVGSRERAELIARTETMHAANEGQRQAWNQAVKKGLLTGKEKRTWIATEVACPLCMGLDGKVTGLNGEYPGGGDGPPLHPRCRCTEGIVR